MNLSMWNRRRADLAAVIGLVILWLFFFWRLYTPTLADQLSISQGDFSSQYYNFSAYQSRRFDSGTPIPLWNPYNYVGSPFLADPQAAAAYPVRWLFLALYSGKWNYGSLQTEVMVHFLLASLLMYVFVRQMTGKPLAGTIAAVAFAYGGYLSGYPLQQVTILESGTWLPLALLGIHRATLFDGVRGRWGWYVVGGIGLGLILLAGHPQAAMLCGYLCAAYLVYRMVRQRRRWWELLLGGAIFAGIGFGLAAVMLLPTVEFQALATRATDLNYNTKAGGYPISDITQLLWSIMTNLYAPMYIGVLGLILIGVAVVYRRSEAEFWLAAGLIALILSFGGLTALYQLAYAVVPGASLFRNQERAVMIWAGCASILAGIGAARLLEGMENKNWLHRALIGLTAVTALYFLLLRAGIADSGNSALQIAASTALLTALTCVVVYWVMQNPAARGIGLLAVLVFDLFSLSQGRAAYTAIPAQTVLPPMLWMDELRPRLNTDPYARIDATDKLAIFGSLFGMPTIQGTSPLRLAGTERIQRLPPPRYWNLLAVRYVVTAAESLPVEAKRLREITDWSGRYFVYELEKPAPMARLVYAADVIPNEDTALQTLSAPDYPLDEKVVLRQTAPLALNGQRPSDAQITYANLAPEHLKLKITTGANALLLVSFPYHPGWRATLNGQSVAVLPADLGLMAIPVAAGSYDVVIEFRPMTAQIGGWISNITLWLTLTLLILWLARSRFART